MRIFSDETIGPATAGPPATPMYWHSLHVHGKEGGGRARDKVCGKSCKYITYFTIRSQGKVNDMFTIDRSHIAPVTYPQCSDANLFTNGPIPFLIPSMYRICNITIWWDKLIVSLITKNFYYTCLHKILTPWLYMYIYNSQWHSPASTWEVLVKRRTDTKSAGYA